MKTYNKYDEQSDDEDSELFSEIKALENMKKEKANISETEKVYHSEGLCRAYSELENINLSFLETMEVCEFSMDIPDENNDIERELSFFNHSLLAVRTAREKLEKAGESIKRPTDYFCEHVKSDAHMARIKDRLLLESKKIEAFEMRKTREYNRKFSKQVSALKTQAKSEDRKSQLKEVSRISRQNSSSGEKDAAFNKIFSGDGKSKKRQAMDQKYGFGGKDRQKMKLPDKRSLNDLTDFNPRGGKFVRKERSSAKSTNVRKKASRPGKSVRSSKRNSSN